MFLGTRALSLNTTIQLIPSIDSFQSCFQPSTKLGSRQSTNNSIFEILKLKTKNNIEFLSCTERVRQAVLQPLLPIALSHELDLDLVI
jgi:hypothetical protein